MRWPSSNAFHQRARLHHRKETAVTFKHKRHTISPVSDDTKREALPATEHPYLLVPPRDSVRFGSECSGKPAVDVIVRRSPVKPPKKRGWGGGGRGDDLYVRELVEPEKSALLTTWRDFAKADGGERFAESIQILNDMIAWRSGVIAARKRRFTLACCKGTAVQAVACVQIGPKNESVRSFLAQDACMSLCLLIVDPEAPMFKSGAHLCKEIKEIGRSENMAVDFEPIKDIYSGRFYAATLAM